MVFLSLLLQTLLPSQSVFWLDLHELWSVLRSAGLSGLRVFQTLCGMWKDSLSYI